MQRCGVRRSGRSHTILKAGLSLGIWTNVAAIANSCKHDQMMKGLYRTVASYRWELDSVTWVTSKPVFLYPNF